MLGRDDRAPASRPHGRLLFVNVAPDALGHPGLEKLAEQLPSRLVIELTEQDAVQDIRRIQERLRPWIARGALVAVDDAGAGFTSLEYVAEIRPDFLKLCRGMVTGVDLDASRQAVLRATVAFAREVGARVVAEGVERPEELEVLRAAEVDFGQGWLFGRPGEAWPPEPETGGRRLHVATPAGGRLERAMASAATVRDAATVVVEHLHRQGLMPSVYVEQGGRLRCQAVRGYWQIYDGMPALAGIIGRTYRTGEATVVADTAGHPDFLPSIPSVVAELCLPLRASDRVVGVLNAESPTTLGEDARWELERCADLLGRRIEAAGRSRGEGRAGPAPGARRRPPGRARGPRGHRARDRPLGARPGRLRVGDARASRRPRQPLRPPRRGPVRGRLLGSRRRRPRRDRRAGSATAPPATRSTRPPAAASTATSRCAAPAPPR